MLSKTQKTTLVLIAGAGIAAAGKTMAAGAARDLSLTPLELGIVLVVASIAVAAVARTV